MVPLFRTDFDVHAWANLAKKNLADMKVKFFTVHFGADWFHEARLRTFLPIKPSPKQIELAVDRMKFLADIFQCPVGIENLALSLSRRECLQQIEVIDKITEQANCFLLLDVHNLYCQAVNYK